MTRALFVAGALLALLPALGPAAHGQHRVAPSPNSIQTENARPGTTSWQRPRGGAELYASEIAAAPGDDLHLHVSTPGSYRIVVYRLGWYGGAGARQMTCVPGCDGDRQGQVQPAPTTSGPLRADWPVTDVVHTGADWVSGYYLVEAVVTSGPGAGSAGSTFVIVHAPAEATPSDVLVQVPVNTWEAYNDWGGESLYSYRGRLRASAVSFDRPFDDDAQSPMWWEIQVVRFLEREGYDVSYQTDVDTHEDPASLLRHRLVIVDGHDEYWTMEMRNAFDAALAQGTNLAFMNANDAYWRMRYADGDRTLVSYKSLYDPAPALADKTAMFRELDRPECQLMAVENVSYHSLDHVLDYTVTAAGAADPWLVGTGLQAGDTLAGVVGREHDQLNPWPDSCIHPGLVDLFHYDGHGVDQPGDAVRFTAPSGARVFASGAQQFSWALDDWRSDGTTFPHPPIVPWQGVPADPRVQTFMRNALDDLTRPAPPLVLAATEDTVGHVQVSVELPNDPRVHGFVALVLGRRGHWRRVCSGATTCAGTLPRAARPSQVRVVATDDWLHPSAAVLHDVQR